MPPAGSSALRTTAVCVILFLGTVALFSRAAGYGFTNYDDPSYVTANPHVQGGLSWAGLRWAFTGRADYWHPLTWLSHQLDWQLHGDHAPGHHRTSLLWHAANAVLVFLVVRRLTGAYWTSALCAALFAWHPLRVESVVWITERKDVMSGCFFLLTLWAYAAYAGRRAAGDRHGAGRCYGLTLAAFAGGLMSKPVLVTLPGVLLLLDFWPLRRWPAAAVATPGRPGAGPAAAGDSWRPLLLEKVPFFLLSVVIAVVTVVMQNQVGAFTLDVPPGDRLANALVAIPRYLGKFFWPFDLTVCYPHPGHWPAVAVGGAAALGLALTGVALWQARARPWLIVGWGWFLVMLLPSLGLVQAGFQSMADRYTYLPVLGLQLALLWTLRGVAPRRAVRGIGAGAAAVALACCLLRTWDQEATWRDPPTLFTHALAVTRDNYPAQAFLALVLLSQGRVNEAAVHAERAVAIRPDFAPAQDALAVVRRAQGRVAEAMAGYRRVLALAPRSPATHSDLGMLLLQQDQIDAAAGHFQAALQVNPDLISAYAGLALVEAQRGHPEMAASYCDRAGALMPRNAQRPANLAALHRVVGDTLGRREQIAGAAAQYQEALRLQPDDAETHARLGYTLLLLRRPAEALREWEEALRLQPAFPGLRERIEQVRRALAGGPAPRHQ